MLFDLRQKLTDRYGEPLKEETEVKQEDGSVKKISVDLMVHELIIGALLANKKADVGLKPEQLGGLKQGHYNLAMRIRDNERVNLDEVDVKTIKEVVAPVCNVLAVGQIYNILDKE